MAKRLTNIESSRVASIRVKKMKNNCTALARQLPDFYGKQLFFFISHPLLLFSLSIAKFISHFHFVCHCRLAGFSSSITQRETAKERKKTRLPKRVTVVISMSSSFAPSLALTQADCLSYSLCFLFCWVKISRSGRRLQFGWLKNVQSAAAKKRTETEQFPVAFFSASVVTPLARTVT